MTVGPAFRHAALALVVLAVFALSGCLGLTRPLAMQSTSASVSGAVKIVTPSPSHGEESGVGGASVQVLSLGPPERRAGSVFSTLTTSASRIAEFDGEPTYEYLVEFGRRVDGARVAEIASGVGLAFEKEVADGLYVLRDPRRRDAGAVIRLLEAVPGVLWAGENGRVSPLGDLGDPLAAEQWALGAIRAYEAWELAHAAGIVVAVVDTEIDFDHPDLDDPDLWLTGWDAQSGKEYGYGSPLPANAESHGTAVAGIIGAIAGNGVGIKGIAPGVRLVPVRAVFSGAKEDHVIAAIREAARRGAQVINLSLKVTSPHRPPGECSPGLSQVLYETAAAGVVIVAAAGNSTTYRNGATVPEPVVCPASHPSVIAVGAIDHLGRVPGYSAQGAELDLVAPGGAADGIGLIKPVSGGGYDKKLYTGTSFAAPHVSGVVALMLGNGFPQDPELVRAHLHMTAIRPGNVPGAHDDRTGYGRLDALGAVAAGLPRILVVEEEGDRLIVHAEAAPRAGGRYIAGGVPEGRWSVVGWIDVTGDGQVSLGDYFGQSGPIAFAPGRSVAGVDLILQPYDGPALAVDGA